MDGPSSAADRDMTTIFGKEKADNNIFSLFEAEKYVLKSHNESWIDKQSGG